MSILLKGFDIEFSNFHSYFVICVDEMRKRRQSIQYILLILKFVLGSPNIEGDDDIKKLNAEAKKTGGAATFASKIRNLFFTAKT